MELSIKPFRLCLNLVDGFAPLSYHICGVVAILLIGEGGIKGGEVKSKSSICY